MEINKISKSEAPFRTFFPISRIVSLTKRLTGYPVETDLSVYRSILEKIKKLPFDRLSFDELRERSQGLRSKAAEAASSQFFLPEAFALVREASRRTIGLDPFDVQIVAGAAMAGGKIAELPTGEGKTLAAVFPAYFYALGGRGVHILTFNDYLARRDAEWMGPIYRSLGLTVGCVQEGQSAGQKRKAYHFDITYATAKEAGFDFLRDQTSYDMKDMVHRAFSTAIVDEADSILIDEARIPLVISGVMEGVSWDARRLAALIRSLAPGRDYETDDEHRNVFLTDGGSRRIEAALRCGSLYDQQNQQLLEAVYCALHAEALLRRDVDYIVRKSAIEIVDEFTGRVAENRHWPDGLQAAVEAKEGLRTISGGRILSSITLQNFFGLYPRLCGMTATAVPAAAEFKEFYGLQVVVVPPHKPSIRVDHPDRVFTHRDAKRRAIVREIREVHSTGRPVLVGTASVKESEDLSASLAEAGIPCRVLNAKNDELEAKVVAQAGLPGSVTISTNMAGRGTDIKLGGQDEGERDRVAALGGLYVIGTNRHESRRIDDQLRGRAGRQGDPGSSRFFISLEDDLFERYGLKNLFYEKHALKRQEGALSQGIIRKQIAHAQRIVEGRNFDIRRSLNKYSSLVEFQRRIVQDWRDEVLRDGVAKSVLAEKCPGLRTEAVSRFGLSRTEELERRLTLISLDDFWSQHLAWITDTRESIHLVSLGGKTPIQEFQKAATAAFLEIRPKVEEAVAERMKSLVEPEGGKGIDTAGIKGPSSTWTYLVNEDQFGWGVEMTAGRNIGLAAGAALYAGPLFVLTLIARRLRRRKSGRTDNTFP
jgi:preprotein translocase subunit SecA